MEEIYQHIIERMLDGDVSRETAASLISMLINRASGQDIAIIGMAVRSATANNTAEYWEDIVSRVDMVGSFPSLRKEDADRYLRYAYPNEKPPDYLTGAYFSRVDEFDFNFFKIPPYAASLMDPAQRFFLETAWHALEDAGYGPELLDGTSTSVYAGYYGNIRDSYQRMIWTVDPNALPLSHSGNLTGMLPSRISYFLNLRGASMVIDTACSSSLVAVDTACEAILSGQCDMALAGGVKINTLPRMRDDEKMGIESSDGKTRTFDDTADGAGIGEGVAVILLKKLKDAIRDNDRIHAVIKGSACNQDGESAGLTAPNPAAQAALIEKAWKNAHAVGASYIEVHGTATDLGDPIEMQGISEGIASQCVPAQSIALSAVKPNMGHLFEAAGIFNLVKAVFALKNETLPPTIYFERPNRKIDFINSPAYINTRPRPWPQGKKKFCGVSAFGFSGTNCHVVLAQAPHIEKEVACVKEAHLVVISAHSREQLLVLANGYRAALQRDDANLSEIAMTSSLGRAHHSHRLAIIADTLSQLDERLLRFCSNGWASPAEKVWYAEHYLINQEQRKSMGEGHGNCSITTRDKNILTEKARKAATHNDGDRLTLLIKLAELYISGASVPWKALYEGQRIAKARLPLYPFTKNRCWLEIPQVLPRIEERLYYTVQWEQSAPISMVAYKQRKIVIHCQHMTVKAEELMRELDFLGCAAYIVQGQMEDETTLLSIGKLIQGDAHVVLVWYMDEPLAVWQESTLYGLHILSRYLIEQNFSGEFDFVLLAHNACVVSGEEKKLSPTFAAAFGYGKVLEQEMPGLSVRALDVDDATPMKSIAKELLQSSRFYQIAYRGEQRYHEHFMPVHLVKEGEQRDTPLILREGGVYVISGGLGGMGLEIAGHFAAKGSVHVILLSHTPFPEREKWDHFSGDNSVTAQRIAALQKAEKNPGSIEVLCCDITKRNDINMTFSSLRKKYGGIHGIIHAAGRVEAGVIARKSFDEMIGVMNPKILGAIHLDEATSQEDLDFFVIFSSGLTLVGEPGMADYVAANAFLDAFAAYRSQRSRKKTLSIDWVSWKETGMSVRYGINVDKLFKALPTQTALHGFEQAMGSDFYRLLIGQINPDDKYLGLFRGVRMDLSKEILELIPPDEIELHVSGEDHCSQIISYDEIERFVAEIFQKTLGYEEVGIYESFFELGGDSVLLTKMHAMINNRFPQKVRVTDLFEYTSISKLTQYIFSLLTPELEDAQNTSVCGYEDLLLALERGSLSVDEVINQLDDMKNKI